MGLQKVTELQKKTEALFKLEKISREEFDQLSQEQQDHFNAECSKRLNASKGEARDRILLHIENIMSKKTRNDIWEMNHINIIQEITSFVEKYGRMPLKMELADRVGLSRQTLHKHFKEYKENPLFSEHMDQFEFMSQKLLAKMFHFGLKGDVKAGRLYFDMVGAFGTGKVKNQTNYIQINNIQISEEKLKALTEDQLKKVEDVLAEVLEVKLPKEREGPKEVPTKNSQITARNRSKTGGCNGNPTPVNNNEIQ